MRLTIEHLGKRFPAAMALDDVSVVVEPGQIVAIVGAEGAGKTTLLHCLAAVLRPTSGAIRFDGDLLERPRLDLRRRLFFASAGREGGAGSLRVMRYLSEVGALYDTPGTYNPDRLIALLTELELVGSVRKRYWNLSNDELFRLKLCTIAYVSPELALFDAPFACGADQGALDWFRRWARSAAAGGTSVVFTAREIEVAESFADAVGVLHEGRLQSIAPLRSAIDAAARELPA